MSKSKKNKKRAQRTLDYLLLLYRHHPEAFDKDGKPK